MGNRPPGEWRTIGHERQCYASLADKSTRGGIEVVLKNMANYDEDIIRGISRTAQGTPL